MRQRKHEREHKRQRGQYMTPASLVDDIVRGIPLDTCTRVLEPSCGDGAFLSALATRLLDESRRHRSPKSINLMGIEIDAPLADRCRTRLAKHPVVGSTCVNVDVFQADFFHAYLTGSVADTCKSTRHLHHGTFDLIVGNPPFGGTFDHAIEDILDSRLGRRLGKKIKKETYAFFIVACVDLLRPGGRLVFVCSDSLLTIPTMTGLRYLLSELGEVALLDIREFSSETSYPMLVLDFVKGRRQRRLTRNGVLIDHRAIHATPNLSWGVTPDLAPLFTGPLMSDRFVASSGMTTGKNEYFVRSSDEDHCIVEPYRFEFYDAPVTVAYEVERARLGKLPKARRRLLEQAEARGDSERRIRILKREKPRVVRLPDRRYRPYNKANGRLVFAEPTHWIYWEDDGDAVLTYKRTGNWYLRGVGGQRFFGREGLTWQLVGARFVARYLPGGYILDSGGPCAFLREDSDRAELFFALGWLLSDLANRILKTVINHTMNIQSKDFERMPYPWWVKDSTREIVVECVESMIAEVRSGRRWKWHDQEIRHLSKLFEWHPTVKQKGVQTTPSTVRGMETGDLFQAERRLGR